MRTALSTLALLLAVTALAEAQPGVLTKELLAEYTPEWTGERLPDGRPRVSDSILDRMKHVTLEEAWALIRSDPASAGLLLLADAEPRAPGAT